jgi:ankyrin repeat protein
VEDRDSDGYSPLAHAISCNRRDCAERLLYAGAKISNVGEDIEIPDWVETIVAKRKNAVASLRTFIGVMRNRFETEGPHVGNRVPKDLLKLLMMMLWSTRLDEKWEVKL